MPENETTAKVSVNRDNYKESRTAKGTKSLNNGDAVSKAIEGLDTEAVFKVAKKFMKVDLTEQYAHLNPGMQRMCVGNKMRGFLNKEGKIADLKAAAKPHQEKATKKADKADKAKNKAAKKPKAA